jgi:hypothetical protein
MACKGYFLKDGKRAVKWFQGTTRREALSRAIEFAQKNKMVMSGFFVKPN